MKTDFQVMVNNFIAIKGALDLALPNVTEDRDKSQCVHSFKAKIGEDRDKSQCVRSFKAKIGEDRDES